MNIQPANSFGKVAVLFGGRSAERDVSLMSGQSVWEALCRQGVDAHAIDVGADVMTPLKAGQFDRAFLVLHGREGEDGVIQALLQTLGIPYTGSDVASSALAMDKVQSKRAFQNSDVPTLPFISIDSAQDLRAVSDQFALPVCIKPVHEGSSNGVRQIDEWEQLLPAYHHVLTFQDTALVEPWIVGREFTVSIVGDDVLPAVEICTSADTFYDYQAKYHSDDTQYFCPCDLSAEDERLVRDLGRQAFEALGCSGWGRVDFLRDAAGYLWVTEVNTIPGMTSHSLVPMAAKAVGIDYDTLVLRILETSI